MQFSTNLAIIYGNITKDPELRYTPNGTAVCKFSVATNRSFKKNEQWEDVATFHNIVCWGKLAEFVAKSYAKGAKVHIQGRIDNRTYESQSGEKKYFTEIVADMVAGERSATVKAQPSNTEDNETVKAAEEVFSEPQPDSDIPF